jgi:cytidylate kinase
VIVAIDGPAAAGKGTLARALAARLGWRYLDTGAMYRAVALAVLQSGTAPDDAAAAAEIAQRAQVSIDGERVVLDGVDVSALVRAPEVTRAVSVVAAHPAVRAVLVARQRALIATEDDVVMEGRDIGTTVAPDAQVKVFRTASLEERARRRARQLGLPEQEETLEELAADLAARDRADASRTASPFRKAGDALVLDSTNRTVDDLVAEVAAAVSRARDVRQT